MEDSRDRLQAQPLEVRAGRPVLEVAWLALMTVPFFVQLSLPDAQFDVMLFLLTCGAVLSTAVTLVRWKRLRALGGLARIDGFGVTVHGERTVAWAELAHAKLRKRYPGVLILVPRPDTRPLPLMPTGGWTAPGVRRKRLTRRYGSPLVLHASELNAGAGELSAAVREFSGGLAIQKWTDPH